MVQIPMYAFNQSINQSWFKSLYTFSINQSIKIIPPDYITFKAMPIFSPGTYQTNMLRLFSSTITYLQTALAGNRDFCYWPSQTTSRRYQRDNAMLTAFPWAGTPPVFFTVNVPPQKPVPNINKTVLLDKNSTCVQKNSKTQKRETTVSTIPRPIIVMKLGD